MMGGSGFSGKWDEKKVKRALSWSSCEVLSGDSKSQRTTDHTKGEQLKGSPWGHCPREPPSWQVWKGTALELSCQVTVAAAAPAAPHGVIFQGQKLQKCAWQPGFSCLGDSEHVVLHLVTVIWLLFPIFHFMMGVKGCNQSPTEAASVEKEPTLIKSSDHKVNPLQWLL